MDTPSLTALILSGLLGIVHFFSEKIKPEEGPHHYRIISLAAGISISYLFLDLLPHTYASASHLKNFVFIFLLSGFTLIHLAEKYIYQHANPGKIPQELAAIHTTAFFIYYFLVGIVLKGILGESILEGFLFLIPITLHAGLSSASLARIHGPHRERLWVKLTLSLSPLLGTALATVISIPPNLNNIFISTIAGALLYIIVKEFLPEREKGQPFYFALGVALFVLVIFILRSNPI